MIAKIGRRDASGEQSDADARARPEPRDAEAGAAGRSAFSDLVVQTTHAPVAVRQSSGGGLPVLLLHGLSTSKKVFGFQFGSALAQSARLIAIDLPGHGASGDAFEPERTYSLAGYADAVVEVLEQLGIERVVVVGWSLGGHVALELATVYPDLVGVMMIGAPPLDAGTGAAERGFRIHPHRDVLSRPVLAEADVAALARTLAGKPGSVLDAALRRADGAARAHLHRGMAAGAFADQREILATSAMPVAIVNGADDPLVDTDTLRALPTANLWRNTCHLIPRAGHAPFLDSAAVFNHLLTNFLNDMKARARHLADNPTLVYSA